MTELEEMMGLSWDEALAKARYRVHWRHMIAAVCPSQDEEDKEIKIIGLTLNTTKAKHLDKRFYLKPICCLPSFSSSPRCGVCVCGWCVMFISLEQSCNSPVCSPALWWLIKCFCKMMKCGFQSACCRQTWTADFFFFKSIFDLEGLHNQLLGPWQVCVI